MSTKLHNVSNQEIAEALSQIAEFLSMQDVPFKPRAYDRAALAIGDLKESLRDVYAKGGLKALEAVPGVGASIAKKIEELLKTGRLAYLERFKKAMPVDISALEAIEGVGPKTIELLWKKRGIKTVAQLEKAARQKKIRNVPGLGAKMEEKILKSIAFQKRGRGRLPIGKALPFIRKIEDRLRSIPGVEEAVAAGSLRRRRETIGDADIVVVSSKPEQVVNSVLSMPEVAHIYAKGAKKVMVCLRNGMDMDMRFIPRKSFGAALQYFTGNKAHNVALRQVAITKGWKLNEYGLFSGDRQIAGETEEEIYQKLELAYIEPEMREMSGEIELAQKNKKQKSALPGLIEYQDLCGDLQVQSNWTDGNASIEQLACAAKNAGLSYIAITDHTKRLAMTRGLDEKRIKQQWLEIDKVNKKVAGIRVLKGTECDILKDGSLDLPDATLSKLDIVGVSIHSFFHMSKEDMTKRIIKAMQNPHVDIIFHPTGRLLRRRDAYAVDLEALIKAAKKNNVVLEANASPDRLDLSDEALRAAVSVGVKTAINSDAHAVEHFSFLEYGIAQARRGWVRKKDVINAWPLHKMKKMLK